MSIPYVVDGETDLDSLLFNPIIDRVNEQGDTISNMRAGVYSVSDYDDPQDAFDEADQNGVVVFPPGTHTVDTINYRGQSIIGAGSNLTTIRGLPGQDIIHHDPTLGAGQRYRARVSGVHFQVDDSVDASSDFSDRDGIGNAGWALDFPDGAGTPPVAAYHPFWQDVRFSGLSQLVGGQNKSCGIYEQQHMSIAALYEHLMFDRLYYGWYQDAPRTNLMSCEIARDMVTVNDIYFNGNTFDWRIHNASWWEVNRASFHASVDTAIVFASDQTVSRGANWWLNFTNLYSEDSEHMFGWEGGLVNSNFVGCAFGPTQKMVWDGQNCRFIGSGLSLRSQTEQPVLEITNNRNHFELATSGGILDATLIDDQGDGNIVWITRFSADSGAAIYPIPINRSAYTASNVSTDRAFDANSTTLDEVADVLGTLIADLREMGMVR